MSFRRLGGKSRYVDFPLEKQTRWFFVGKADPSIFRWRSRHVVWKKRTHKILVDKGHSSDQSLNYFYFSWNSTGTGKSSGSLCHLFMYIFWYRFFKYTFIKFIFLIKTKKFRTEVSAFSTQVDVSAFSSKNRRVGFSNQKSTCRLFQPKIDVSAFFIKPTCTLDAALVARTPLISSFWSAFWQLKFIKEIY